MESQHHHQIDYEYILNKRIKYGKYVMLGTISSFAANVIDGIEIGIIALILPIMKIDLKLTQTEQILITQSIFVGEILGSFIGGYMGDKYGRKVTLIIANTSSVIFGYLSSYSNGSISYIILRVFVATGMGMQISIAFSQLNEISYKGYQEFNQIVANVFFGLGFTILVIISYLYLDSLTKGDWRAIIRVSSIFASIGLIFNCLQYESILYLLEKKRYQQAYQVIDQAILSNSSTDQPLTQTEKDALKQYYDQQQLHETDNYSVIFKPEYLSNTIFISLQYFAVVISFYFIAMLIPIVLGSQTKRSKNEALLLLLLVDIPEYVFCFLLGCFVNNSYIKFIQMHQLIYAAGVTVLTISLFTSYNYLFLMLFKGITLSRFGLTTSHAANLYPAQIKARVNGFTSFCGRVGGFIMPVFLYPLIELGIDYTIMFILVLEIVFMYLVGFIKYPADYKYSQLDDNQS